MSNLVPDLNLKRIINEYLSRAEETPVSKSDLENIKNYLSSDDPSPKKCITSLEGLQYASNMTGLLIENSLLTNFSKISNLEKISTLFLNNNYIKSLPDLSNMESLTSILLNSNELNDVSILSTGKNLRYIKINENMICDLSPLKDIENLREVVALNQEIFIKDVLESSYFYILDISFLKDINGEVPQIILPSGLGKYNSKNQEIIWEISSMDLNPFFEFITEDGNFSGKVNIEIVDVDQIIYIEDELLAYEIIETLNLYDDIITLKDLLKLRSLDLTNKKIRSLKGLENASNLYKLILDENYITDFKYVPTSVTYLSTENMKNQVNITDERLQSLIKINLQKDIDSIITMDDIKELQILDEPYAYIKTLEGLSLASNLKMLSLPNSKICDLKPIFNLNNLIYLDLSKNNICDLSTLNNIYKNINYLYFLNQEVYLEEKFDFSSDVFKLSLSFLKDVDGNSIDNIIPSDNGLYDSVSNTISWITSTISSKLQFSFKDKKDIFTGTVYINLIKDI